MNDLKVVTTGLATPIFDRIVRLVWPDPRWWSNLRIFDAVSGEQIKTCITFEMNATFGEIVTIEATLIDPERIVEDVDENGKSYKHFYTYTEMWYLDDIVKEG